MSHSGPTADLPESARAETRADLLAGSAGYQHFLQQLSRFISPDEARQAQATFRSAARIFWVTLISFLVAYFAINHFLGPRGLRTAGWGNDALRGALLLVALYLSRRVRVRVHVAGQMLLPLAALCFLPMHITAEDVWWQPTLLFGATLITLLVTGWCLDAGAENPRQPLSAWASRWLARAAFFLFILFNIIAWRWILDGTAFPFLSVAAAVIAWIISEFTSRAAPISNDIDFLYAAAWKRWRFLITGRAMAVIFGIIPFLLFANLLDYEEELERALDAQEAPEIIRMDFLGESNAFFWRDEGRFLTESDLDSAHESPAHGPHSQHDAVIRDFYLMSPYIAPPPSVAARLGTPRPVVPDENGIGYGNIGDDPAGPIAMEAGLHHLDRQTMTREEFETRLKQFEHLRITSRESILRRTKDPVDLIGLDDLYVVSFHPIATSSIHAATTSAPHAESDEPARESSTSPGESHEVPPASRAAADAHAEGVAERYDPNETGFIFVEQPHLRMYNPHELEILATTYAWPKWIFFAIGIIGFVFLWRRGGDSSLARWIGIWLIGISLIPTLSVSDDTLPHLTHWLWQQSIFHHWNSFASTAQPLFAVLYLAAASAAMLWLTQVSPAVVWAYLCWPTKIYPRYPVMFRNGIMLGKVIAVLCAMFGIFCVTELPLMHFLPKADMVWFIAYFSAVTIAFVVIGGVLRHFTYRTSEVPRLSFWAILAVLTLNACILCYSPSVMFTSIHPAPRIFFHLGTFFGIFFVLIICFMILKQDFLRIRAIAGFTMLILLIFVPWFIHTLETAIPQLLTATPFFRERGAEMVALMFLVLLFPRLHHALHEFLLVLSIPALRRIEHRVEHALEEIVDAEEDSDRVRMISELFEKMHVSQYLFLSRRPKGLFVADINKLASPAPISPSPESPPSSADAGPLPDSFEFSHELRHFLGKRRHFIDLRAMAFEWPFFFHQFELFRLTQSTQCRFLLPISVGDSLRGLLLLPDTPDTPALANPAISPNLNNLGLAASLSHPKA